MHPHSPEGQKRHQEKVLIPMPRADNYAYVIAYVRALRSRLLSEEQYEALLKAKDGQDVLRCLSDTVYSSYLSEYSGRPLSLSDIDSMIFKDYHHILKELMNIHTTERARQLLETTYLRHEFSCLRIIMRLVMAGASPEKSAQLITPLGRYTPEHISRLLKAKDLRQLFSGFDDPKIRTIAIDGIAECEEVNSTIPVEMAVDRFHLNSLWAIVGKLDTWDKEPVRDIVGTEIDTTNIGLILRGKHLGMPFPVLRDLVIPIRYKLDHEIEVAVEAATALEAMQTFSSGHYGTTISDVMAECERQKTLLPLELALKRFFAQRCSHAFVGYPFGIGPLLAFLNLKYFEALDIRALLLGKREKKSAEELRHLLLLSAKEP